MLHARVCRLVIGRLFFLVADASEMERVIACSGLDARPSLRTNAHRKVSRSHLSSGEIVGVSI